jgi:hypothetical protein
MIGQELQSHQTTASNSASSRACGTAGVPKSWKPFAKSLSPFLRFALTAERCTLTASFLRFAKNNG